MQAGKLNTRIKLLRLTTTRDRYGDEKTEFTQVGAAWANLKPISNRKIREQGQSAVIETWLIVFRRSVVRGVVIEKGWRIITPFGVYTVRNVDHSQKDRITITAEVSD